MKEKQLTLTPRLSITALSVFFVGVALLFAPHNAAAFYSNGVGDGSSGSPYQVRNCNDLTLINTDESASYVLINDIDCRGISTGSGTFPIAMGSGFSGTFDGQGHQIYNLTIDSPSTSHIGLFSELNNGAVVKNVSVYATVTGDAHTGIIAGNMKAGALVSRVDTHGSVTCTNNCGGIVGSMVSGSSLERSWGDATIGGVGYVYGGLVGWVDETGGTATISDVYYRGTVSPSGGTENYVGGIVGFANSVVLSNAYSTGTITGGHYVGGIVGMLVSSTVSHTFTAASVMGVGMGVLFGGTIISTATDNYYDTEATGWSYPDDGYGSTGELPSYFTQNSSSDVFSTWNFTNNWRISYNDYPALAPISDPYMLCEEPHSTDTTILGACATMPPGWGITTWEARWQKQGDSTWHDITLDNEHVAIAQISSLTPGTWYNLQFRYTNDFGTGNWGTVQILTTGTAPSSPTPSSTTSESSSTKDSSSPSEETGATVSKSSDTTTTQDEAPVAISEISHEQPNVEEPKNIETKPTSSFNWPVILVVVLISSALAWYFKTRPKHP